MTRIYPKNFEDVRTPSLDKFESPDTIIKGGHFLHKTLFLILKNAPFSKRRGAPGQFILANQKLSSNAEILLQAFELEDTYTELI